MGIHWKVQDADFHSRRAEAERRAAMKAKSQAAAAAHRELAMEHQAAAFIAGKVRAVPATDGSSS